MRRNVENSAAFLSAGHFNTYLIHLYSFAFLFIYLYSLIHSFLRTVSSPNNTVPDEMINQQWTRRDTGESGRGLTFGISLQGIRETTGNLSNDSRPCA